MKPKILPVLMIVAACVVMALPAAAADSTPAPGPLPYARLAATWWEWALETPTPDNPLLDPTGAKCAVNQTGGVWFLAGTFGGDATRTCAIPAGKKVFFPVVNMAYGAFLNDPPATKSLKYLRERTACVKGSIFTATLDGKPLAPVHERSIPFVVNLPEDNVLGATPADIKNLMLAPTVDEGYYVLLPPLSPGAHTIEFSNAPGTSCSVALHVTYHLTVG